ncbi:MAG: HAD family hydrolase, partial [Gemmatimonadetes bacterium]|nr:HAD family hydrolase [Gemmatimonadota bacterium]
MKQAAVLFDVGNTLLHLDYARMAGVVRLIAGLSVTADDLLAAAYAGRRAVEEAMANGVLVDAERHRIFLRALLADIGAAGPQVEPVIGGLREEMKHRHLYSMVPPGTRETLVRLKTMGYAVGAVSNSDGHVKELLADAGLADTLEFIVDSGVVGIEKPDPRIFQTALSDAQVPAAS